MRYVTHRFILGDIQIAENQAVYRPPFRAISNAFTDHPFVGAYDFSAASSANLCVGRVGSMGLNSGSVWTSTAGRYGGGVYFPTFGSVGNGTAPGPVFTNKSACSLMVKFPTNVGQITVTFTNCSFSLSPIGSGYTDGGNFFGSSFITVPNIVPADASWHHFLLNFDGATGTYQIYLDGSLATSSTIPALVNVPPLFVATNDGISVQTGGGAGDQATSTACDNLVTSVLPFTASAISKLNSGQLPSLSSVSALYSAGWF